VISGHIMAHEGFRLKMMYTYRYRYKKLKETRGGAAGNKGSVAEAQTAPIRTSFGQCGGAIGRSSHHGSGVRVLVQVVVAESEEATPFEPK
jgi:hypothetical protein